MNLIRIPKLKGSAPASGAVFRALAENIERTKKLQESVSASRATAGREGASGNARGGRAPLFLILVGTSLMFLTGCRGAPSINLLGSFFPGWMLCMVLGVVGAFVVREVCIRTSIEPHLRPRVPVYFCLWELITLLVWLLFFRS